MRSVPAIVFALSIALGAAGGQIAVHPFLDLPGETSDPNVSPDGSTLAFNWWPPDIKNWGIYLRPMSGGKPRLFAQSEDVALSPKWSPDGRWIACLSVGTPRTSGLWVKPMAGGDARWIGPVCSSGVTWTADSRFIITPNNGDTDDGEACKLLVVSVEPGRPSWQLAERGTYPALSPDGKTLAFVSDREIRLLPLTRDGHAAGVETTLVRENLPIINPAWVPGTNEIVYLLSRDSSVIRRVGARPVAKPRDDGSIDGEFGRLSFAPIGGPVLAEVASRDDSFWRIDLQAHEPRFDELRRLPWNVANLSLSPDGQTLVYTVSTRGRSEYYRSNIDGTGAKLLFSLPYERADRPVWSPDGREIAFTAAPVISQLPPSHLFIAPAANGSPRRLLKQFEEVTPINWSRDGKALFLLAGTEPDLSIWKLNLVDGQLTRIVPLSGQFAEQVNSEFIYFQRLPFSLARIPIEGGPEEPVLSGVMSFVVGSSALYFTRQDANPPTPEGLNLYRFDLPTHQSRFVARALAFGQSLQLSPDGRFIYSEKHAPRRRDIMIVRNWH